MIAEKVPDCPFIDILAFITEMRDFGVFQQVRIAGTGGGYCYGRVVFAREIAPCLRIQKNKEFDAIEHLVPETTFRYLKERFS